MATDPAMDHFVKQIVDEVLARLSQENSSSGACAACTDCCTTRCVHRMQAAVAAGGARLGLPPLDSLTAPDMAQFIDHTLLKPETTRAEIRKLCAEARQHHFASVCVNPVWVKEC